MMDLDRWLTVRQAAKYVQCGTRPIYDAIERRELKATPINSRGDLRIKREWIDEWLTKRATRHEEASLTGANTTK